jgi:hypothetical protein
MTHISSVDKEEVYFFSSFTVRNRRFVVRSTPALDYL